MQQEENKTVDIDTTGPAMDVDSAEENDQTEVEQQEIQEEPTVRPVVEETADWFDRVTVKRNMSDLGKQANQFHKIATEAQSLNDRMSSLYEDMGNILNRYFKIQELNEED